MHAQQGTAGVQVKHGKIVLPAERYANDPQVDRVFLFAASGDYGATCPDNVTRIKSNDLIAFARKAHNMLPEAIRYWFERSQEALPL